MPFRMLVGGPIAGAILGRQHGMYDGLIIFAGATMLVGAAITFFVKLRINSNVLAKV
jgi:hypothetical protein